MRWGSVSPLHQAVPSHPSWLWINPDDHEVCTILYYTDKYFQVCRANLCQHKRTQPMPSTKKIQPQQNRANGSLQRHKQTLERGSISKTNTAPSNWQWGAIFQEHCFCLFFLCNRVIKNHILHGCVLLFGVYVCVFWRHLYTTGNCSWQDFTCTFQKKSGAHLQPQTPAKSVQPRKKTTHRLQIFTLKAHNWLNTWSKQWAVLTDRHPQVTVRNLQCPDTLNFIKN